jgi:hypothetical protein
MQEQNVIRNRAVVVLRKLDPKMYSFGNLAQLFKVQKHMVHKVYLRDRDKYGVADGDVENKGV